MKTKNTLIKIFWIFSILWIIYNTIEFLLAKTTTLINIFLVINYIIIALFFILVLITKISIKINNYKNYKIYENSFYYLKTIHKERYKLYFTGKRSEIEIYDEKIKKIGNRILTIGKIFISNNLVNKKCKQRVEDILKETEVLMGKVSS